MRSFKPHSDEVLFGSFAKNSFLGELTGVFSLVIAVFISSICAGAQKKDKVIEYGSPVFEKYLEKDRTSYYYTISEETQTGNTISAKVTETQRDCYDVIEEKKVPRHIVEHDYALKKKNVIEELTPVVSKEKTAKEYEEIARVREGIPVKVSSEIYIFQSKTGPLKFGHIRLKFNGEEEIIKTTNTEGYITAVIDLPEGWFFSEDSAGAAVNSCINEIFYFEKIMPVLQRKRLVKERTHMIMLETTVKNAKNSKSSYNVIYYSPDKEIGQEISMFIFNSLKSYLSNQAVIQETKDEKIDGFLTEFFKVKTEKEKETVKDSGRIIGFDFEEFQKTRNQTDFVK